MKFPLTRQPGIRDCGPACLKMVADYHGKNHRMDYLRRLCGVTKVGVSLMQISDAAEKIGMRTVGVKLKYDELVMVVDHGPCIIHWKNNHFVVVYGVKKRGRKVLVADPANGRVSYTRKEFIDHWIGDKENGVVGQTNVEEASPEEGFVLILETSPEFYVEPINEGESKRVGFGKLWFYFKPHRRFFFQLVLGMALSSFVMLLAPFLTQSMVDNGINMHNMHFVYLILIAQMVVFVGSSLVQLLRTWILLHIGTRVNLSMLSDFFQKLLRLPVSFFERHITGDILQRINDHKKLENMLTVSSLSTLFSIVNLIILSFVLYFYSSLIFVVLASGSVLGVIWTIIFLRKRRKIDYQLFEARSYENNKVLEILSGVPDIKLSSSAKHKRWEWETLQTRLFAVRIRALSVGQTQEMGSSFISRLSTIFITFIAAQGVIQGSLTLGTMFAINMIIGQIHSPISQLIGLISKVQEAKIALERINDVVHEPNEEEANGVTVDGIPDKGDIVLHDVSFSYRDDMSNPTLNNLNITIPEGKVTAIVGASGSGKSTLIKLLLRFYEPNAGNISLNGLSFRNIEHNEWRSKCGVVLQDGRLFSGTIAENIALGMESNYTEIMNAAKLACIHDFVKDLPQGYMTEVGQYGSNLSTGQKQRILLARAIYKKPSFLFLDEATSALDTKNEKDIMNNLGEFFEDRTVVIVAHRLSTVKNADQLIVMDNGEVVEFGNHLDLTKSKGVYYSLVKNQLELGL